MSIMKIDIEKTKALADDLHLTIRKHLHKTSMSAGEITQALTQVIYCVGRVSAEIGREKALRAKTRGAA